ncbi:MAG: hypothetical protein NC236_00595 [Mycoplasma sp.]|nr:hypothetical protein [Mycoplasma sp.]
MSNLSEAILIVSLVIACLGIIAVFYLISAFRRISITVKKIDYLVEDLTYKSELLNNVVEIFARLANYWDAFEIFAKRNVKSTIRFAARNKDVIYRLNKKVQDLVQTSNAEEKKRNKK